MNRVIGKLGLVVALLSPFAFGVNVQAGDWPQILGPNRNGITLDDERLAESWPSSGPPVLWSREVGAAVAGVAVSGPRAILFHRERDNEVIECLQAENGQTLWKQSYPTTFYAQVGGGTGPLCVPTITEDVVITYGAQGVLTCCRLQDGTPLWQRKTHQEFSAREGYFGAGSSPLVVGDLVVVNVGGTKDESGVIAFDLATGKTRWTRTEEPASYAAPVLVSFEDQPHVLMVTRYKCLLLDGPTGAIRFEFPFGQRGPTVNAACPLVIDNKQLFLTASYGIGAVLADFGPQHFQYVWERDEVLSAQYCTPIHQQGILYGIHGREDVPPADLRAIELQTGKLLWDKQNFGYGTIIAANGKLLIQKTDGDCILGVATPTGFKQLAHHRLLNGEVRALPALSSGRLYVRNEQELRCVQVGR
ncbi:MAG: PQQ-binding-like beta-propeller repeat protein [Planctomycetaceae bacterium]|nr:PQQ-binding-like beta-propeller repeat protein [Planctomycetaceae bacterium]